MFLGGIRAGLVARRNAPQIVRDRRRVHRAKGHPARHRETAGAVALPRQTNRGDHAVRAPLELSEHPRGFRGMARLAEDPPPENDDGVGAERPASGARARSGRGLVRRVGHRHPPRPAGAARRALPLPRARRHRDKPDARSPQQRRAPRRSRGEEERFLMRRRHRRRL